MLFNIIILFSKVYCIVNECVMDKWQMSFYIYIKYNLALYGYEAFV